MICAESYKDELAALGETSSVHLQHAGSAKLKGKRDEIAVYSVHPATTKPAQLKSSMEFQHAPLHGRSGAIEDLMTSLGSLAVSKGGLVLVNATVGLGKSALMQAIAAKLEDEAFPEYEFLRGAECALFEALPVRGMPMHICHCVLEWILEAGGHQSAWELCVLEVSR